MEKSDQLINIVGYYNTLKKKIFHQIQLDIRRDVLVSQHIPQPSG